MCVCVCVCCVVFSPECVSEVWQQPQEQESVMDVTCNGHVVEDLKESTPLQGHTPDAEDDEEEPQNPYADNCSVATETHPHSDYAACNGIAPVAMAMPSEPSDLPGDQACGGSDGNWHSVIGSVEVPPGHSSRRRRRAGSRGQETGSSG